LKNVHAPTNEKTKEIKEEFYNLLEQNINQIARSDIKIFGDLKKTYTNPPLAMKVYTMKPNNNEIKMIQSANSEDLDVRSAFPHKDIHKETWYSAHGRTANQIDQVLISKRFVSTITDIRVLSGPDIVSDHRLLKINFKVELRIKTVSKYNENRKTVNIFQNPKWKQEYTIEINKSFEILENLDEGIIDKNINEKLKSIKTIIKETKQQLIEKDESTETLKNKWYDETCKFVIEGMKKAREKRYRDRCENYRGIALGNVTHKILSNIILGKIKPHIGKITGAYQNGFQDGKSVIDSIFAWKIINHKIWEYNQCTIFIY
jgi:hypothetical protein